MRLGLVRPLAGRLLPGHKLIVGADGVTDAEARRALDGLSLGDVLTEGREVVVEVRREVPAGTTVAQAHSTWLEEFVDGAATPFGLPRLPVDEVVGGGTFEVTVELIDQRAQGMGRHFGFEGDFVSLLVQLGSGRVVDARAAFDVT